MYFWREDEFKTLRQVAADARTVPLWSDYAAFCEQYERGLRTQEFAMLEAFITKLEHARFADRRAFVSWLAQQAEGRQGRQMLIPHQLQTRLMEPTLLEWTMLEPGCAEPHLWLGRYDDLKFLCNPD